MTALAVVLLAFGAALLVLVPVWALLIWSARRERRRVARLSVSRCAEVTGAGQRLCAVDGRSWPGAEGPLTAPLSGEPCVWYFSQVEGRSSDGEYTRVVWEAGGTMAFTVRDETGSVLVDGHLVHPDHRSSRVSHRPPVRRVIDEDVRSARDSTYLRDLVARGVLSEKSFERGWLSSSDVWRVREYVLPVGEPLHVQGRPGSREDGRPVLGAARRKHLVTGGTYAQLTDSLEQDVRTSSGCLLTGTIAGALLFVAGWLLLRWIGG